MSAHELWLNKHQGPHKEYHFKAAHLWMANLLFGPRVRCVQPCKGASRII